MEKFDKKILEREKRAQKELSVFASIKFFLENTIHKISMTSN
jgi:hypothetical protein